MFDVLVVVVGIFLGFQLDRWNEDRKETKTELRHLERLKTDLEIEKESFQLVITRTGIRLGQIDLLKRVAMDPGVATTDPSGFIIALEQVTWRNFPIVTAYTYKELQGSGRMSSLTSGGFRRDLADYYAYMEDIGNLGFAEPLRNQFDELTAGLLSGEQLGAIEDPGRFDTRVSPEEALAVAHEFALRKEAHKWLPSYQQYEALMRVSAEKLISMENRLIARIDSLTGR
ncbi:MAG: hypothetical protein ACC655_06030 [Rhodothermia bacterium]